METGLHTDRRPAPAGTCVLALTGEADMDTAPVLARALTAALAGTPRPDVLVVDCARLTFCASAGLNELLRARRAAEAAGVAFRLAAPGPQVVRLLDITGTDAVFEIDPGPVASVAVAP
ncbi:STAS domain-containing protein [Kitasatospora sp. NPDC101176]|uniref:STAS domain-containing protein n=1 Tax=Kitasatospora sp. NPDC101176 TaxID=3364099 RepID=UPI003818878D